MDPGTAALIASAISAAGSIGGGILSRGGNPETKMEKTKRKLTDQLLASLSGEGPYAGLYSTSDKDFEKSVKQPLLSQYRNQIAPQIQQEYIASGQQRGSGLEDQLLRAGIDLDQMLNKYMVDYQQGAMNRSQNTISSILGGGAGAANQMSAGQAAKEATGGYLSSPAFSDAVAQGFKPYTNPETPNAPQVNKPIQRGGFEPETVQNYQFKYR